VTPMIKLRNKTSVPEFYRGNEIWVRVPSAYELNHE